MSESGSRRAVLLIAPRIPPYGGMGLQADLMQERLQQEGVPVIRVAPNALLPKGLRFVERLRGVRSLIRLPIFCGRLWRELPGVDVIHVLACSWSYFFLVVCPSVVMGRLRRKRVVLTYHGGEAEQFFRKFRYFVKPFFRMADVVTAPSAFLVGIISRWMGVPVQGVPNIISFATFRYRERNPVQPKMLVTRHLEELYDVETVIRAFRQVQSHYREASLWIVGTGSQERYLRKLVTTLNLPNVRFLGYVPYDNLPEVYDQCDILLNASRADNFPGSLIEAAAAGLVVISTGVGGIPYIFEHGKSAMLVEAENWSALSSAVLQVLGTPDLFFRLTKEALQECRKYEWTNVRRLLYPVYGFELPEEHSAAPLDAASVSADAGRLGRGRLSEIRLPETRHV